MDEIVVALQRHQLARDEAVIRELLSRWVSGCEPAVARDHDGAILGLCDAAAVLGSKPWLLTTR